jgi:hypothetical protein
MINWRDTHNCWKNTMYFRSLNVLYPLPHTERLWISKQYLLSTFSSGRNIYFSLNSPVILKKETHVCTWRSPSKIHYGMYCTILPLENWVCVSKAYNYLPEFSSERHIHFKENSLILLNWGDTCICWRIAYKVEAWISYTKLFFENWVIKSKESSLSVSVFKWEIYSVLGKQACNVELKRHM